MAVHNRTASVLDAFVDEHGDERIVACASLDDLPGLLESPRVVVLMVTAGRAVDAVLDALGPLLEPGDIVVDGGNSNFADTERRVEAAAQAGLHFVGMGVSGGEEGALRGPSMMPGGDHAAWDRLAPPGAQRRSDQ